MNDSRKVVVYLMGGLGNQLFQYSMARYIAKEYGIQNIEIDISRYKISGLRKFELGAIVEEVNDISITYKDDKYFEFLAFLYRVYGKIAKVAKQKKKDYILNKKRKYYYFSNKHIIKQDIFYLDNPNMIFLYGYFFDIDIANNMKRDIYESLNKISSSNICFLKYKQSILSTENTIAVSIRCGKDYVDTGWPICTKSYYTKGIETIKKEKTHVKIYVFADEIEKIKNENWFDSLDVTYIEKMTPLNSMKLLMLCQNFVCANSTFSWWGALLGQDEHKMVVMPKHFFQTNEKENVWFDGIIHLDNVTGEVR